MEPVERHHTATAYIVHEEQTLLLWHKGLGMWLPPGGHCEANEDPVQAAVREAFEESAIAVEVIPPPDLLVCAGPQVLPPPAVILVEDIVRSDQPFHQHIDHVYFTQPLPGASIGRDIAGTTATWVGPDQLGRPFSLRSPGGSLVQVAEDVRLLGLRAIAAAVGRY